MRSFEAENDVDAMLNRASEVGVKQVFIINSALRAWLTAKGYSRKRDPQSGAFGGIK
jgi:N-acetylglutamate synthase-like GNAT family acetyltransferase